MGFKQRIADYLIGRTLTPRARLFSWAERNATPLQRARAFDALQRQFSANSDSRFSIVEALLGASKDTATRRSVAFPAINQLGQGRYPGFYGIPKSTPFALRRFSETPPMRRAIGKVKAMTCPLPWRVQPKHGVLKEGQEPPAKMQKRIDAAEYAFAHPNDTGETWRTLIESLVEDTLLGYGAAEVQPTGDDKRPFCLWPVDGASIRINPNWQSDDNDDKLTGYRYTQSLSYSGNAVGAGMEPIFLKSKELMYVRMHPRTCTPFGLGPAEVAFSMVNAFLGSVEKRERQDSNATPDWGMFLGEDASPEDVERARYYWETVIEGNGKVPIWGGFKNPEVLQFMTTKSPADIDWPEFVLRMIAISFGLSPQTMGVERDVNRNTAETMKTTDFIDAAQPVIEIIQDSLTSDILYELLGWDDLEVVADTDDIDRERNLGFIERETNANIIWLDEARERLGYDSYPEGKGEMTLAEHEAMAGAAASKTLMEDDSASSESAAPWGSSWGRLADEEKAGSSDRYADEPVLGQLTKELYSAAAREDSEIVTYELPRRLLERARRFKDSA